MFIPYSTCFILFPRFFPSLSWSLSVTCGPVVLWRVVPRSSFAHRDGGPLRRGWKLRDSALQRNFCEAKPAYLDIFGIFKACFAYVAFRFLVVYDLIRSYTIFTRHDIPWYVIRAVIFDLWPHLAEFQSHGHWLWWPVQTDRGKSERIWKVQLCWCCHDGTLWHGPKDWKTPTTGLVWRHVLGESKIIWIIPGSSHNMEQFFLFAHISHHDGMMTRCDRCWYVASPVFPCRRQSSALLGRSTGRKKLGSAHGTLSS